MAFDPHPIIATPLGGWLQVPHQPTVHLPYDLASDVLYQPSHHGVWCFLTAPQCPGNAWICPLCLRGCHCCSYPTANTLPLPPRTTPNAHLQEGLSLKPLPVLPAETLSEHTHGIWKEQAWPLHSSVSLIKASRPLLQFCWIPHMEYAWLIYERSSPRICHCCLAIGREPIPTSVPMSRYCPCLWHYHRCQCILHRASRPPCSSPSH